jgi:predicted ATPase with chaperone activity
LSFTKRLEPATSASPARSAQVVRQGKPNCRLATKEIDRLCAPDEAGAQLLKQAIARLNLSARAYLRTLLIHGARAVIRGAERKPDADPWLKQLLARRNKNVAAVALANKNARTIWALLAHDREYKPDYGMAA